MNPFKKEEKKPTDPYINKVIEEIKQHDKDSEIRFPKESEPKTTLPPLAEQLSETGDLIERRRREKLRTPGYKPKSFPEED